MAGLDGAWTPFSARGRAKFTFAANGEFQLSLNVGDELDITDEMGGWYCGAILGSGKKGIFPSDYVELIQQTDAVKEMAIEYFDQGKYWERAIEVSKRLCTYYESQVYEYQKLSSALRNEADMYEKIMSTDRFFSEYFRVAYYGNGFSQDFRGKEFVYKGNELEKLADFLGRITAKFPNANIIKTSDAPGDDIINGDGQYIQITTVKPANNDDMEGKQSDTDDNIPDKIKKFRAQDGVNLFVYSKSFRKNKEKKGNDFMELWVCHTYIQTRDNFPTIHRRSDVVEKKEVNMSPIQNALDSMVTKNKELVHVIKVHESRKGQDVSALSMILNGVIDAAVQGGVYMFKDFFSEEYLTANPDDRVVSQKLKEGMQKQFEILGEGLKVHKRMCPEALYALQDKMEEFYNKLRFDMSKIM